jgi:hypothetical protein
MSKKKKNGGNGKVKIDLTPPTSNFDEFTHLHGVIHKEHFELVNKINVNTKGHLGPTWIENMEANAHLWKKHPNLRTIAQDHIGKNKAVIGVGAGPSFNKNKDVFKQFVNADGVQDWEDRCFLTISSNHQFKPLLNMGVIPDFVLLVDAGTKGVYEQLCVDIPESGRNTTLITGLHCSPRIVEEWLRQGREICFFLSPMKELMETFQKKTGKNPKIHKIELGGNCLNGMWMISLSVLASGIFIGLGNDLSYPLLKTVEERREKYYADGDYTTNAHKTGSGRDEASVHKKWGGFSLERKPIITGRERYNIRLDPVGTSYTLWVYKAWLETVMMLPKKEPEKHTWHYFNCSEGGILGVMARKLDSESMEKQENWYMLDEVTKWYHTAMFEDAAKTVIQSRRAALCQASPLSQYGVQGATNLVALH